jgi:hypothetical protein
MCAPFRLKYSFGEFRLFAVSFHAAHLKMHFTELGDDPSAVALPFADVPEIQAAVVRSHPVRQALPVLTHVAGAIRYVPTQYRRFFIDLSGTFDGYLKKFSGKTRSTLQRKVRKFKDASGTDPLWTDYSSPGQIGDFWAVAQEVSRKSYQHKLLDSGLPDTEAFRAGAAELARQNAVLAAILWFQGKPAAYLYCPAEKGILFYDYLGYDPAFAELSAGTVLQYLALEKLFSEQRFRLFDFTEGEGPHKELLATGSVQCADIFFFRPTLRNKFLLRLHMGLGRASRTAVRISERLGIKRRLKNFIRRRSG